jgi:plasmid stabilization system protein ParE
VKSRFHKGAARDLREAVEYYDLAAPGLGARLVAEVRAAVGFLETFPLGARRPTVDIHGKALVRFPHTLLYIIEQNEVVILAVAHQRQDIGRWFEIVRGRREVD